MGKIQSRLQVPYLLIAIVMVLFSWRLVFLSVGIVASIYVYFTLVWCFFVINWDLMKLNYIKRIKKRCLKHTSLPEVTLIKKEQLSGNTLLSGVLNKGQF